MKIENAARLGNFDEYYLSKILSASENNGIKGEIINLAVGNTDLLPPEEVIEELKSSASAAGSHLYQPNQGDSLFLKEAAGWYKKIFNVCLNSSDEIVSLIGSKEGIFLLSLAYLNNGDAVLVPDPGYPIYAHCASLMESSVITYSLTEKNKWQIDIEELERKYTKRVKILWLNSPHMPTGTTLKTSTFKNVIDFARSKNILVVHDNPYSMILNEGKPFSIFSVKVAIETAVELCSLSKSFNMPGFRIAVMAGNKSVLKSVLKIKSISGSGSYLPIQRGAVKAFSLDKQWFNKQNDIYEKRRVTALKMTQHLNCHVDPVSSGMFVWAKLPGNADDKIFCRNLIKKTGVLLTPGSIYGKNGKGYIRISLCQPDDVIKIAEQKIKNLYRGKYASHN